MNLFRSLGVAGWALGSALRRLGRPILWVPFLVLAAVQLVSLEALVSFHRPGISALVLPLVTWVGGIPATHYPAFYVYLPVIFSRWDLVVGVLLASLTTGAATLLFVRAFGVDLHRTPWREAGRRYPALVLVSVVGAVLSLVVFMGLGSLFQERALASAAVRWGMRAVTLGAFVITQGLIVYATAWILLEGKGALGSLGASVRTSLALFLPTMVVLAVSVLVAYPFDYLAGRGDLFLSRFRPELMSGVLVAKILVEALVSFVLVGAVTRLFLWRREEAR